MSTVAAYAEREMTQVTASGFLQTAEVVSVAAISKFTGVVHAKNILAPHQTAKRSLPVWRENRLRRDFVVVHEPIEPFSSASVTSAKGNASPGLAP